MNQYFLVKQHLNAIDKYPAMNLYSDKYNSSIDAIAELNSIINTIKKNKNWCIENTDDISYLCSYFDSKLYKYLSIEYSIISIFDK